MAVVINAISVDFTALPNPTIEFLQGRNMNVTAIRDTLRQIEATADGVSEELSPDPDGFIVKSTGNEFFNEAVGERNAMTVTLLNPFITKFQAGPIPFITSGGNLLFAGVDSPGAIVVINNAVGSISLNSKDIEHASFDGGVTLDVIKGKTLAEGARGNALEPLNNHTDVATVLTVRGFNRIYVVGSYTFGATDNLDGCEVIGINTLTSNVFTMIAGVSTKETSFKSCHLQGVFNGNINTDNAVLLTCSGIGYDSILQNTIYEGSVAYAGVGTLNVINGSSGQPDTSASMDWTGVPVAHANISKWSGVLLIKGLSVGTISIFFSSGSVILDPSCTGGTVKVFPDDTEVKNLASAVSVEGGTEVGAIVSDVSNSSISFRTNLTSSINNAYKDVLIKFISGTLKNEVKRVSGYDGTTHQLTFSAPFSATPAGLDEFKVINE